MADLANRLLEVALMAIGEEPPYEEPPSRESEFWPFLDALATQMSCWHAALDGEGADTDPGRLLLVPLELDDDDVSVN